MSPENSYTNSTIPECIPARILNEYVYCPRLAYIEWVQSDFSDNFETVDGRYTHRSVDREKGEMSHASDNQEAFEARSVWMSAPNEHLTARIDVIMGSGNCATVVDYKRGVVPENAERSWDSDRVQLCAQGLILRSNGYVCDHGILYYASSRTKVEITFTDELLKYTRRMVQEVRNLAESGKIPAPLEDSPKCIGCSLVGICLPDETNLVLGQNSEIPEEQSVRRILPARDSSLPLYVQEQGASIVKRGELFEVLGKKSPLGEARIFETSQVSVFGNVQITTQAMREMCYRNIPVSFFSTGGWFYGMAHGMSHKNVELRRFQFDAARDPQACLTLASAMVAAKIKNCRTMLMRNHVELRKEISSRLKRLATTSLSTRNLESLLGTEGAAANAYFSSFSGMLKPRVTNRTDSVWEFDFTGRNRRPPLDPVNAMLSYAYSLLAKDLTVTALKVGLDPFMGFFHQPRFGRPALALDLMEEFRPIIADSVVISVINNGIISPKDFTMRGRAVALKDTARKKFIQAYERRMDALVTHPVFGYRISYRRALEVQSRLLGRVITKELPEYRAFVTR